MFQSEVQEILLTHFSGQLWHFSLQPPPGILNGHFVQIESIQRAVTLESLAQSQQQFAIAHGRVEHARLFHVTDRH